MCAFLGAIIHETGHLISIIISGEKIKSFSLSIFGADIKRSGQSNLIFNEIIINLAGPAVNLLAAGLCFLLSKPINNNALSLFTVINLCLGIYNILPFWSFDGGKILSLILSEHISRKYTDVIITVLSLIIVAFFAVVSYVKISADKTDFFPAIVTAFLLLTLIFKK